MRKVSPEVKAECISMLASEQKADVQIVQETHTERMEDIINRGSIDKKIQRQY